MGKLSKRTKQKNNDEIRNSKKNRRSLSRTNESNSSSSPDEGKAGASTGIISSMVRFFIMWILINNFVKFLASRGIIPNRKEKIMEKILEDGITNRNHQHHHPTDDIIVENPHSLHVEQKSENLINEFSTDDPEMSNNIESSHQEKEGTEEADEKRFTSTTNLYDIPKQFAGPMTQYPNPLNITDTIRQMFHPVIKFPKTNHGKKLIYTLVDFSTASGEDNLISRTEHDQKQQQQQQRHKPRNNNKEEHLGKFFRQLFRKEAEHLSLYQVGKYDENRVNLYSSDHFHDTSNTIDGYSGARTLHIGIDLGAPVGTKVYSIWNGRIHSLGYNDAWGDYGFVVVVEYEVPKHTNNDKITPFWVLYGHLDSTSIKNKTVGQKIKRGATIGRIGDVHENGGWVNPHVHFQISVTPPETHDMPGAVTISDRPKALIQYPDPRHILGPLY